MLVSDSASIDLLLYIDTNTMLNNIFQSCMSFNGVLVLMSIKNIVQC